MTTIQINAENEILGRLATKVATILTGKNKPTFQPYLLSGDSVTIYNAEKIKISGNKNTQKKYYHHSGHLGHLKTISYEKMFEKDVTQVIQHAVSGMLPKNRLRKEMLKRLTILKGPTNANK